MGLLVLLLEHSSGTFLRLLFRASFSIPGSRTFEFSQLMPLPYSPCAHSFYSVHTAIIRKPCDRSQLTATLVPGTYHLFGPILPLGDFFFSSCCPGPSVIFSSCCPGPVALGLDSSQLTVQQGIGLPVAIGSLHFFCVYFNVFNEHSEPTTSNKSCH